MKAGISIGIDAQPEMWVITPSGPLGHKEADMLNALLRECPSQTVVAVDLSAVAWLVSSALASLIWHAQLIKDRGGVLAIVSPSKQVAHVLHVTHLNKVLSVCMSMSDAREYADRLPRQ